MKVDDQSVCSKTFAEDLSFSPTGADCIELPAPTPGAIGDRFPVVAMEPTGTCGFELSAPETNGGNGLSLSFRATFDPETEDYQLGTYRDTTKRGCTPDTEIVIENMFELLWLAQFECTVFDGDLTLHGDLPDLSPLSSIQTVSGSLTIAETSAPASVGALSNLSVVADGLIVQADPSDGRIELPSLTEIGRLELEGQEEVRSLSLPQLQSAGNILVAANEQLEQIDLRALQTVGMLDSSDNPALTTLSAPLLTSAKSFWVSENTDLPACRVATLGQQVGVECMGCDGNGGSDGCD